MGHAINFVFDAYCLQERTTSFNGLLSLVIHTCVCFASFN